MNLQAIRSHRIHWLVLTIAACLAFGCKRDVQGGLVLTLEVAMEEWLWGRAALKDAEFEAIYRPAVLEWKTKGGHLVDIFHHHLQEAAGKTTWRPMTMAVFFSGYEGGIRHNDPDDVAVEKLKAEYEEVMVANYNIILARIDRLGVEGPTVQLDKRTARIHLELPGVKDMARVRRLFSSAKLEFWETRAAQEVYPLWERIDAQVATIRAASGDTLAHPFLSLFDSTFPIYTDRPLMGIAAAEDTGTVNKWLAHPEVRPVVPPDLKFLWETKPIPEAARPAFGLIAIKTNREDKAPLDGTVVTDARVAESSGMLFVEMSMSPEGAHQWARLTQQNIGKAIAIVLDDQVYSYPKVQDKITGGRSQIAGNFTYEEAEDLANVLKAGRLPVPVRIVHQKYVGPSAGTP